ncbi:hypothetical protein CTP45_24635 [Salmonella enterica]|uniref:Uncharacterized protein n=1 Tax=Salmonella enterica subsp. enterica serovar Saintpaul TaxID=90105 RepID=A0A5U9I4H8_SALET|nr:hypothetical protein [Salmonella enterica]EBS2301370.1 hypothetical protein [Salmonella enterica subsp. enterica serovar Saintpaul]EDW0017503.1 hypothetical protein [Salmonella enterica subsp. enterica serovar Aba]HCZ4727705.1 hypothetical protein [Salmonella enterica subsp. enterica serovar Saintpaul str. CFSAN004137]EAW8023126.1 hypothetical protein [Salmonella enterica]
MNRNYIISLSLLVGLSCGSVSAFAVDMQDAAQAAEHASHANRYGYSGINDAGSIHAGIAAHDAAAQTAHDKFGDAISNPNSNINAPSYSADVNSVKGLVHADPNVSGAVNSTVKGMVHSDPNLAGAVNNSVKGMVHAESIAVDTTKAPTGSINVAASSLSPSTKVNATVNGVTTTTTAGELAKVNPQTQVAIPHVDAIMSSPERHANDHSHNNTRSEHGTGNGGNNAANSNSAHGLGGGNHIGGGSAQSGSRSVGKW